MLIQCKILITSHDSLNGLSVCLSVHFCQLESVTTMQDAVLNNEGNVVEVRARDPQLGDWPLLHAHLDHCIHIQTIFIGIAVTVVCLFVTAIKS